ncbi:MFS transporter, NNP family, nitrate/nitrite transporter [uncultured bacterium]|nr:MFS transporter [Sandaracinaceae bacterium]CAG1771814.1 MFS transporter, NNP family, nitrate/nitrite transporter [uncultured bacterium]
MSASPNVNESGKGSWLSDWRPEDSSFWEKTGSRIAWRTLTLTTITLVLSFASWFVVSALVVRLPGIGFQFDEMQLFWLAAMPGLAGGTLRIIHTFLIPIFGTRLVISIATLLKLIPCIGLGLAVMDPSSPWWLFMLLAFLAGMGGGDFSSYMPSTSLFFPKRLQGSALGIQAGVGNFGVSLAQFVTPWIIGFALFGTLTGGPQVFTRAGQTSSIWLQNATFWYVPLLAVLGVLCWMMLRSVPVRASFREQLDIFKDKHTWFCTVTYVMTFGSFSGFSAAFPLMIKSLYGGFPDAPDPLAYAFYGPLIGSATRVVFGFVADKIGGAVLTTISGVGMIASAIALVVTGALAPTSLDSFPLFVWLMLSIFFFSGIGNASTFRQYPLVFAHNPRQGAQVLGWTGAVAAYGPFAFATLIGLAISRSTAGGGVKSAAVFFIAASVFYAIAVALNWWYYQRKGAERPS